MDLIITEIAREKQTLCLSMIVKNEAHIIVQTLKNLCDYFKFDYWVISDTGSTDSTKELIKTFFEEMYIPGEIVEHKWEDFGYNRTKALEAAYNKTDYLLIFDADDSVVGHFKMPEKLTHDRYMLKFGQGFEYMRPLLITNKKKWCFKGVLHEFLASGEPVHVQSALTEGSILGDYFLISGRHGNRSKNPNKYYDDAMVLEKGFATENLPGGDKGMADRYAFYCAQSYKDSGPNYLDKAIEWYTMVLDLGNWGQEKYYACCQLGLLYKNKNDMVNAVKYWLKSSEYDKERIEGVVSACEYYYNTGVHLLVNSLYERFKNYNKSLQGKLFINQEQYKDELEYYNSISGYYTNNKPSGYEACKRILINGISSLDKIKTTIKNIMFYNEEHLLKKDIAENTGDISTIIKNINSLIKESREKGENVEKYIIEFQSLIQPQPQPEPIEVKEPTNEMYKDVNDLFHLVLQYKDKHEWNTALKYCNIIKDKYKDLLEAGNNNSLNNEIYTFKNDYEYSIIAYYTGLRNINDTIIQLFKNCENYSILSSVLSNMKFYKFVLQAEKTIEFKLATHHTINGQEYFFNSSSSCIIPNTTGDGYLINARLVNYRIDNDGNYVDWGGRHIFTMNHYIELNKNFDILKKKLLKVDFVDRMYVGVEDVRIFKNIEHIDHKDTMSFIGTGYHANNKIGIVYGDYDLSKDILYPKEIKPIFNMNSDCEKNWVYINYKGEKRVIYNWHPIKICKIIPLQPETTAPYDLLELVEIKNERNYPLFFRHIRGSTCAFEYKNEFWFIVHMVSYEKPRHYYHFMLVFDDNMNLSRYSAPFKFEGECIEYCVGLVVEDERVIATYSAWDRSTTIALYNKRYIDESILIYRN